MKLLSVRSWKGLLIHLGIIAGLTIAAVLIFFDMYLPSTTNHGETVTVPDLEGLHIDEINEFLTKRNLKHEVTADSGFTQEYQPLTVLTQYPLPGAKVKENRKIFLSLNAVNPPQVKMPRLIDGSVKNAALLLESYGLEIGQIKYVPDLAQNAVLEQTYDGEPIEAGTFLPKGAKIDLLVGDGLGNTTLEVPALDGLVLDEAEVVILGSGLKVGNILFRDPTLADRDPKDELQQSQDRLVIVQQRPVAGRKIRIGQEIDIWLDRQEKQEDSILDEEEESTESEIL
ncbi:PASTA domain-containing protein [Tunicatimonas pelagia]|uniref:PASTA domain-containing protein n=1 Tax=Tunicatimonas pelagia TaxID=931531 RepID=UPI002666D2BD|nr:PASTA domain-containing protein [Tunicatimonas pelagia]WKN42007.1 PASTA domain-containing protein [Tunicatimonas pelagia]